jgi:hypothetical protein
MRPVRVPATEDGAAGVDPTTSDAGCRERRVVPMATKKSSSSVTVEWFTIPVTWVIGLAALLLVGVGWIAYRVWLRPLLQKPSTSSAPVSSADTASFIQLSGRVEVKKVNDYVYRPADFRMPLGEGDMIRTGSNGMAEIVCPSGSRLRVHPDTLLRLECSQPTRHNRIGRVEEGAVVVEVSRQAGLVSTGSDVRARLETGTTARIRFLGDVQESFVEVQRGQAVVQSRDQEVAVGSQEGARVARQGSIEKRRLLEPPLLKQPLRRQQIPPQAGDSTSVTLEWTGVPDAVAYELEIASRQDMLDSVRRVTRSTSAVLQIPNRFAGVWYFWRVRAIDAQRLAGDFSETRAFMVGPGSSRTEAVRCSFEARPQMTFSTFVVLLGKTHPSCMVTIAGEPVAIQSTGQFRHFYRVRQRGLTREPVVIESPQGVIEEWTMEVLVDDRGIHVQFHPPQAAGGP